MKHHGHTNSCYTEFHIYIKDQGATDVVLIFHKSLPEEWDKGLCKSAQIIVVSLQDLPRHQI